MSLILSCRIKVLIWWWVYALAQKTGRLEPEVIILVSWPHHTPSIIFILALQKHIRLLQHALTKVISDTANRISCSVNRWCVLENNIKKGGRRPKINFDLVQISLKLLLTCRLPDSLFLVCMERQRSFCGERREIIDRKYWFAIRPRSFY